MLNTKNAGMNGIQEGGNNETTGTHVVVDVNFFPCA